MSRRLLLVGRRPREASVRSSLNRMSSLSPTFCAVASLPQPLRTGTQIDRQMDATTHKTPTSMTSQMFCETSFRALGLLHVPKLASPPCTHRSGNHSEPPAEHRNAGRGYGTGQSAQGGCSDGRRVGEEGGQPPPSAALIAAAAAEHLALTNGQQ
jgi:hypothetical protein